MSRPTGHSNRRIELPVAGQSDLRVPTGVHHPTVSSTIAGGESVQDPIDRTVEPSSQVVMTTEQPTEETAPSSPGLRGHAETTALGPRPPKSGISQSSPSVPGEDRLKTLGFSESVIKRIVILRAASTQKHRRSQWNIFLAWTTEKKLNPLDASLPLLTSFMEYLFRERGDSVRTILNNTSQQYPFTGSHKWGMKY